MWVDLCTRQGSFIELQVDSDHPSHGHVGCSLLIQTAVIKVCVGGSGWLCECVDNCYTSFLSVFS